MVESWGFLRDEKDFEAGCIFLFDFLRRIFLSRVVIDALWSPNRVF